MRVFSRILAIPWGTPYLLSTRRVLVDRSALEVPLTVLHVQSNPLRCLKVFEVVEFDLRVISLRLRLDR